MRTPRHALPPHPRTDPPPPQGKAYYAGDIKNGPFACFGVETPNRKIIIKQHDGYRFGAGVCALHNVRAWLYEWLTGREWVWQEHVFQWDKTEEKMAEVLRLGAGGGAALEAGVAIRTLSLFFFLLRQPLSDVWWLPTNRHRLPTNRHRLPTNRHRLPTNRHRLHTNRHRFTHRPPS